MKTVAKKKAYKKIALALSLCALIIWGILGTGASLAWFTDTSPEINNIFHFADFKLKVFYFDENKEWTKIEEDTKIFDENALYEPGYVQIVYLKVENEGTLPFNFYTAVNVNGCIKATNVFDQSFMLQDYLKFGVITDINEQDIINGVIDRELAIKASAETTLKDIADMPLHNYDTDPAVLQPEQEACLALIVRMPEDVNNIANYRGDTVPKVELGITVKADQTTN